MFSAAKDVGVDHILAWALNLKGTTRKGFSDSVRQCFLIEYSKIKEIYINKEAYKAYKAQPY